MNIIINTSYLQHVTTQFEEEISVKTRLEIYTEAI